MLSSYNFLYLYLHSNPYENTMKRTVIILIFCTLCVDILICQNPIPNANFENWTDDNSPELWSGLTIPIPFFPIYTVSKTLDSQNGNFAMLIETKELILLGAIPGIASLAPVSINLLGGGITFTNAGIPVNVRPTKILGYVKFDGVNGDTAMIAGVFTRWNTLAGKRDTLGMAGIMFNNMITNYTPFHFNINLSHTPDSMNILLISSGGMNPQTGSALWVDNLSMQYNSTAGTETIYLSEKSAFPNPTSDEILFEIPGEGLCEVIVLDIAGKKVLSYSTAESRFLLDVRSLSPGMYVVTVRRSNLKYIHKACISR